MIRNRAKTTGPISDEDAELLERLGRLAETIDPIPDDLVVAAKALFALRDPMGVLMETVDQDDELMAVRGATATQMHFFEYGDVSVDLEVSTRNGFASVMGVLAGTPEPASGAGVVSLQTAGASFDTEIAADGRFVFHQVPAGMFRLQVDVPGEPPLTTRWVDAA